MNSIRCGDLRICVLSGNHVRVLRTYYQRFFSDRNNAASLATPGLQPRLWMRATACMVACAPPQASVLFWRRRLGSYHSQPLLGGRRKSQNATHGTATVMQLSSKSRTIPRHRWGTLFCDLLQNSSRERGCCPGGHSLSFTIYRLSRDRRQSPNSRRTASGAMAQCEHAMSRWINCSN